MHDHPIKPCVQVQAMATGVGESAAAALLGGSAYVNMVRGKVGGNGHPHKMGWAVFFKLPPPSSKLCHLPAFTSKPV